MQEKCIEQQVPLYQVFVDLTKAFDTVTRDALWKVLGKLGCQLTFVHMFRELHRDMKARVAFNGRLSDKISVDTGINQGDIPAPTLFSIYFEVLLGYAFSGCDVDLLLSFRASEKVFNLRRFNTKPKVFHDLIWELLYADDTDFLAHMQVIVDNFSRACDGFGLKINLKKTKVMFTSPPGEEYIEPNILVNGTRLDVVNVFVYLGSVLSKDASLDAEVYAHIQKAFVAFGRLERRLWNDHGLTINTKVDVYMACVVTVLLYAAETWTIHQRHIRVLEHFHLKSLRRILDIKWQMHTPDTELLEKAMITTAQLRWVGHLIHMNEGHLPKQLFYGELTSGKHPQHKPRKHFKDGLKSNLKDADIDVNTWEATAVDRGAWWELVKTGCSSLHVKRLEHAKLKRALRKPRESAM